VFTDPWKKKRGKGQGEGRGYRGREGNRVRVLRVLHAGTAECVYVCE